MIEQDVDFSRTFPNLFEFLSCDPEQTKKDLKWFKRRRKLSYRLRRPSFSERLSLSNEQSKSSPYVLVKKIGESSIIKVILFQLPNSPYFKQNVIKAIESNTEYELAENILDCAFHDYLDVLFLKFDPKPRFKSMAGTVCSINTWETQIAKSLFLIQVRKESCNRR
jgi:hypothetical protein